MCRALRSIGLAATLLVALAKLAGAADYGMAPPDRYNADLRPFWTKVYPDGSNAWEKAAAKALRARGFSEKQIAKVGRLDIEIGSSQTPRGRPGRAELNDPPMKFNTETGARLPADPLAYAAALPDCYKTDERSCTLTYSAAVAQIGTAVPCLLPRRTVLFCQRTGFQNARTWNRSAAERAKAKTFAPFCGEQDREFGCGADQIVFDGEIQTKLAFNVGKAESGIAKGDTEGKGEAEERPKPSVSPTRAPRIVYRATKDAEFARREGPPSLEEWEYDVRKWMKYSAGHPDDTGAGYSRVDPQYARALKYCFPHDVYHPCNVK